MYSHVVRPGILRVKGQKPKYIITDHTGLIANRKNATLELGWNIQPWVGALWWPRSTDLGVWKKMDGGFAGPFDFPDIKGQAKPSELGTAKGGEKNRGKPA